MNKEQDEFKLVKILNKYFPDILLETLSECANEIIQAGYVQLQADSDGLVKKESRCVKCRAENNGECFDIECTTHSYERGFKDGTVDQKALCDAEWREKIENLQGEWISVAETYCPDWVLDLRYILSQMEEE
jgi:hypothetical protein